MSRSMFRLCAQAATWCVTSVPILGQCPMCREVAAAQGVEAAAALDVAILILLVPAVGMFCGVYVLAFRHRDPEELDERR